MEKSDVFDKKSKESIYPIVEKLYGKCAENKLPFFVAVCVANDAEKTEYEYEALLAALRLDLNDNKIAKLLFSFNGFDINLPDEVKMALETIRRYADRLKGKETVGVGLTEDQIDQFLRVIHGAEVTIPRQVMEDMVLDDDFFDD